jgi:hypothetical protein
LPVFTEYLTSTDVRGSSAAIQNGSETTGTVLTKYCEPSKRAVECFEFKKYYFILFSTIASITIKDVEVFVNKTYETDLSNL